MAFSTIGSLQIKIGFIAFGEFNLKFLVDSAFSHSWKIKWGDFKSIPFHLKTFGNNFTQFDIMLGLRPELILICGTFVLNWHFYNYSQSAKSCRELKINNFSLKHLPERQLQGSLIPKHVHTLCAGNFGQLTGNDLWKSKLIINISLCERKCLSLA